MDQNDRENRKFYNEKTHKNFGNFEKETRRAAQKPESSTRDRPRPQSAAVRSSDLESSYRFDPVLNKYVKIINEQRQKEEHEALWEFQLEANKRKVMDWLSKMDQSR